MSEPSHEHPLAGDVDWLLNRIWLGFGEERARALEPVGLTVREHVLLTVLRATNATQLELGSIARVDKSVLTTTIDSLEQKGLVVRTADPKDRRVKRPQLTEKGAEVCAAADVASEAAQARLLDLIPARSRADFVRVLHDLALGPSASTVSFSQNAERPRRSARSRTASDAR